MAHQAIWPKLEGSLIGSLPTITQGSTLETITILALYSDGTAVNLTGKAMTATMRDGDDVYSVTGTLTGGNGSFTWKLSAGDIGTDGGYSTIFTYSDGSESWSSDPAWFVVRANPSATAVQNPALVGISSALAAWTAAAAAAVPDGDDVIGEAPSDGSQYARQDGDWEEINVVSDVGGLTTTGLTTANMLRVKSGGGIEERTPAQVLSDIGAVGTASLSAAPTAAEPLKADGSGGIRFAAKLSVGSAPTADDTLFNAKRALTGVVNSHGYRDESTHTPGAGSVGYCAFDSEYSMAGGTSYDHYASFQNRPAFSGSGTITKHRGFWSLPTHTGTGTITSLQHFHVGNVTPSGGGAITTQYGLYVEELTGGATDYAVFTAGATPSYFGGLVQAGSNFRVDGLASFGNVAANTAYQVYIAANLDATKVAGMAALAVSPINVNTGNSYGLFFSNAAQNNTLASIGTNYTYGMSGLAACYATSANSAARGIYGGRFGTLFSANASYTATAIYAYAITVDTFAATGAGTISIGETVGINIENQGSSKAPTSHGLRIKAQSGSSASYSLYTEAGTVRLMASAADKIGFHGATPVAQQLLATGAGATVDNVITALQTLGLLRQS